VIDTAHVARFIAVHPVVVTDTAWIGTEFFVGAAAKANAALKA